MAQARSENADHETPEGLAQDIEPFEYSGSTRTASVPPCKLTKEDLRRLYAKLYDKAQEALERQLEELERPPDQSPQQFEETKRRIREVSGLVVAVQGARGEETIAASDWPLKDEALPDKVSSIAFDNFSAVEAYNFTVENKLRVQLDFSDPPSFQEYNPWRNPTPNESQVKVSGPSKMWVTGVYEWILGFLSHRKHQWGWLHSATTFSMLNWLFGFPAALWVTHRFDALWLAPLSDISGALRGATNIYVFLIGAMLFRGMLGGVRWIFPQLEFEGSRSIGTRAVLATLLLGLLTSLIYDIITAWP